MAQSTISFKIEDELKEEIQKHISDTDLASNKWLEMAFQNMITNQFKLLQPTYQKDINELEFHTSRVNELFRNMITQSEQLKDAAIQNMESVLDQKEKTIQTYINTVTNYEKEIQNYSAQIEELTHQYNQESETFIAIREQHENNLDLIKSQKATIKSQEDSLQDYETIKSTHEKIVFEKRTIEDKLITTESELTACNAAKIALEGQHELAIKKAVEEAKNDLTQQFEKERLEMQTKYQFERSEREEKYQLERSNREDKHREIIESMQKEHQEQLAKLNHALIETLKHVNEPKK